MQLLQDLPFSCVWMTRACFQASQLRSVCEAWYWQGMLPGEDPHPFRVAPSFAVGVVLKFTLLNTEWHKLGGTGSYIHNLKAFLFAQPQLPQLSRRQLWGKAEPNFHSKGALTEPMSLTDLKGLGNRGQYTLLTSQVGKQTKQSCGKGKLFYWDCKRVWIRELEH